MAKPANLRSFGSDATALLLTALFAATVLLALRALPAQLPQLVYDHEVALTLEAAPPAPPAPLVPSLQPPQKRHLTALRQAQTPDPLPVAADPAPADITPLAAIAPADPPAPGGRAHPDLDARYAAELRADIDRRTSPPDTAQYRLRHPFGEARVRFVVLRSGAPEGAAIERSSGSALLDDQAIRIVASGNYPPMPAAVFAGESQHLFVVTIEFRSSPRN